jgi:hypothetical protein
MGPKHAVHAAITLFQTRLLCLDFHSDGALSRRGVRFSLLYLLRDPRGNALSQLYAFNPKWFSEYSSPMTEVLKEHCRIAAIDVAAMNDFSSGQASADGVEATQICFEDFKDRPQGALSDLYSTFGPFRRWYEQQPSDGRSKIVPEEVEEFGKEHIANWEVSLGCSV